jgi:hypothetical protein
MGAAAGVVAAAGGLAQSAPVARAAPLPGGGGDGTAVIQGSANINTSQTGTVLNAFALSNPAALLTSDNSASGSRDGAHTSGVTGIGPTSTNGVIGIANGSGA